MRGLMFRKRAILLGLLILIGTTLQRVDRLVHVEISPNIECCLVLSG
jgi:hypothetical protein